jgi:CHAD domain-containing protein
MEVAPLRLSLISKASRGYEVASGKNVAGPVHSESVDLPAKVDREEAFQKIAYACLHQIADNYDAVVDENPVGVHQMRVGLRRLRAAISLFKEMLEDEQTARIKKELKWLTNELGPARQFQVFCTDVARSVLRAHRMGDGIDNFIDDLDRRFDEAKSRATGAVSSERFRRLLLDTAEWIQVGAWKQAEQLPKVDGRKFAKRVLAKRRKKIAKNGKKLDHLNAEQRHKLRIAAKKLRYGSEFFSGLFPGKKGKQATRKIYNCIERSAGLPG